MKIGKTQDLVDKKLRRFNKKINSTKKNRFNDLFPELNKKLRKSKLKNYKNISEDINEIEYDLEPRRYEITSKMIEYYGHSIEY